MSDGVRLRVVAYTAQCVRVVCSVSVFFVCTLFLRPVRCTRSHHTGLCQHAFPKGVHAGRSGHTLSQLLCAQYQDPEPLALPRPAWEPRQRQQGVSILASQNSWARLGNAVLRSAPMPVVALITLAGCIPPKRVTLKRTHGVTAPLYRCLPD